MPDQPIDEQLSDADVLITNAQADDDIMAAFATVGRDAAYFTDGQSRLDTARALHQQQDVEYGEQYAATDDLHAKKAVANDTYMRHLRLARIALEEDTAARAALRLDGRRRRTIDKWLGQAQGFYDNLAANDAWMQAVAGNGVTPEDVTAAQAEVEAVAEARRTQERETGEAQQATEAREEALDHLDEWMSKARKLARVALEGQPQKLEELGILARS